MLQSFGLAHELLWGPWYADLELLHEPFVLIPFLELEGSAALVNLNAADLAISQEDALV